MMPRWGASWDVDVSGGLGSCGLPAQAQQDGLQGRLGKGICPGEAPGGSLLWPADSGLQPKGASSGADQGCQQRSLRLFTTAVPLPGEPPAQRAQRPANCRPAQHIRTLLLGTDILLRRWLRMPESALRCRWPPPQNGGYLVCNGPATITDNRQARAGGCPGAAAPQPVGKLTSEGMDAATGASQAGQAKHASVRY